MVISVSPIQIQNVLRTYGRQLKFARLNSENKTKIKQGQVDRVDISNQARRLLLKKSEADKPETKP